MATAEDVVSRFAFDDSYFRADNSVKHRAFMPSDEGCTSVFIVTGLTHVQCVAHGNAHVTPLRGKPLRGFVKVSAQAVFDASLQIADDEPPPKHANLLGWQEDLQARKLQAQAVAEEAEYFPV